MSTTTTGVTTAPARSPSRTWRRRAPWVACVWCLAFASTAAAQNDRPPASEPGTEIGGIIGAGSNGIHTGPFVAGIAGWRLTNRVHAEARASWLARGAGADAFSADLAGTFRLGLIGQIAPYLAGGFGMYRATFDSRTSPMSAFYERRWTAAAPGGTSQTFTDPAFRLSAGIDWRARRGLSIRPEASALFVRRDGRGETIGLFGLRIGYHFEDRVVTP